ncbi:MarR family transcriptional regulator [Gordonia sp. CPCC 206044]|uniref:MarR family winged helix-turn-helix transcriptional regulator n=1 Tax=Gordonia sp. CPCC 206044 TaxID=3140793 RepID=UPI003AF369C6
MPKPDPLDVASDLRITVGSLVRQLRQRRGPDDPSVPETMVLARLDRDGPCTSADLARREQVSPQAMGTTVAGLLDRGLVDRTPDPADRRRIVVDLTPSGVGALNGRRNQRTVAIAEALSRALTDDEITTLATALPLLDRLREAL